MLVAKGWTLLVLGAVSLAVASCSGNGSASAVAFDLRFPSIEAAVAADSVEVRVFDGTKENCQALFAKASAGAALPAALATTNLKKTCSVLTTPLSLPEIAYGRRAVLASATDSENKTVLLGCSDVELNEGTPTVDIFLSLASRFNAPPPPTPCKTLGEYCAKSCSSAPITDAGTGG